MKKLGDVMTDNERHLCYAIDNVQALSACLVADVLQDKLHSAQKHANRIEEWMDEAQDALDRMWADRQLSFKVDGH